MRLIHIATIRDEEESWQKVVRNGERLLFLREVSPGNYGWYLQSECEGEELPTSVGAGTIEEAMRLGSKTWAEAGFESLKCGYRYTLPDRDEHGTPALFFQMKASYQSSNGIYFDEEVGGNCIVSHCPAKSRRFIVVFS